MERLRSAALIAASHTVAALTATSVSGEVTPDEYRVNKVSGDVTARTIGAKQVEDLPDPSGAGTVRVNNLRGGGLIVSAGITSAAARARNRFSKRIHVPPQGFKSRAVLKHAP